MKIVLILLCIIISILIIRSQSTNRLKLFILGICFFSMDVRISISPPINAQLLFIISYFISLWYHKEIKFYWKYFPVRSALLILLLTHLLVGLMDERLNLVSKISRPIFVYAQSYFCIFLGYTGFNKIRDINKLLEFLLIVFGIVGVYGLATYLLQNNPYYDLVNQIFSNSDSDGMWSNIQDRGYRVCSFFNNPIPYGFVMGALSLSIITLYNKKYSWLQLIAVLIIVLNVFLSNSRSSIIAYVLIIIIYRILQLRYSSNLKYFITGAISVFLVILAYFFIPVFTNSINSIIDIFTSGGSDVRGSNIDIKSEQWAASLLYFLQNPIWGNGFFYFQENLLNSAQAETLYGLEGYIYKLLVEEGALQIIAVLIFYISLMKFYLREWNNYNNIVVTSSVSILLAFLFFIISVGTYGNVFVFIFFLLGLLIKYIQLLKIKNEILHINASI